MALGDGLVSLLRSSTALTSLLSDGFGSISVGTVDELRKPNYVVLSSLSTDNMLSLDASGGMRQATVDFDCVSFSKTQADQMADVVETLIGDYSGPAGSHTIRAVILDDRGDDERPVNQGSQKIKRITTVSAEIQYE